MSSWVLATSTVLGAFSVVPDTWIIRTTQKFELILAVHINIHIAIMKLLSSEEHIVRHYINDILKEQEI